MKTFFVKIESKPQVLNKKVEALCGELEQVIKEYRHFSRMRGVSQQVKTDRKMVVDYLEEAHSCLNATSTMLLAAIIEAVFPSGRILSQLFSATKKRIYDSFREVIKLKEEIYGVKEGQQSHTWTHGNGKLRVTLGYNVTDDYDDTASAGVQKVHNYISSLAKDAETRSLVNAVLRLLAKDGKTGTLKNSRILALRKMAEESGNADFIDGVDIIDKAYIPVLSKQYIKMWYKNDINEWMSIPMSMTEAKNSDLSLAEYTQLMEVLNVEFSEFIKPAAQNSNEEDKG